ncbi:MAG: hypothetical protein ABSG88_09320 [Bradyrhizobium sp.]|jgi:hypothetical protein
MDGATQAASDATDESLSSGSSPDFAFLPQSLTGQCRSLIESYHGLHGYGCLPDILWKAGLGPFIETHREFRLLLRKASTTRSSKKSNDGFAQIATTLLSLEILASNFAGWSMLYPHAASTAKSILKRHTRISHTPLMESYLYPPRYISQAAIATLATPTMREPVEADAFSRPLSPDAAGRQVSDIPPMATSPLPT